MRVRLAYGAKRPMLVVAAVAALLTGACALDEVSDDPLFGPSETGVSVQLTALPDTLNADGVSVAQVRLTLRDNSGNGLQGQAVYFTWNGDGDLNPASTSRFVGDVQSGFVMASDANGIMDVVYTAGTSVGTITIFARPYGIDGVNFYERSVDILQR